MARRQSPEAVDRILEQRASVFVPPARRPAALRHVGAGPHRHRSDDAARGRATPPAPPPPRPSRPQAIAACTSSSSAGTREGGGSGSWRSTRVQRSAASAASPRLSASRARQSCRAPTSRPLEQFLGLRVVALAALQLRERGDRRSGLRRAGDGEILDGGLEDRLGLGPAAAPDVDVAVVRSAQATR